MRNFVSWHHHFSCIAKTVVLLAFCFPMFGCRTIRVSGSDLLQPNRPPEVALKTPQQTVERYSVDTPSGKIAVTRISKPNNKIAVLYCGGNQFRTNVFGGDVASAFPISVDIVMFDYPGYGGSTGKPTVANLMQTAAIVYDRFLAKRRTQYNQLVVYGSSMGGFVASDVAARRKPDRLILEGTAPDAQQLMASLVPWFAKPFISIEISPDLSQIDNVARLKGFSGPVLLLVGTADVQTKPSLMRDMGSELRKEGVDVSFLTIKGGGHGEVLGYKKAQEAIANFLTERQ